MSITKEDLEQFDCLSWAVSADPKVKGLMQNIRCGTFSQDDLDKVNQIVKTITEKVNPNDIRAVEIKMALYEYIYDYVDGIDKMTDDGKLYVADHNDRKRAYEALKRLHGPADPFDFSDNEKD